MLLEHIGENMRAHVVRSAIDATLRAGIWTPDLGGNATTSIVTEHIIDLIHSHTSEGARS
jgi:isocitrate/isopropylmalate dehydrogenase